MLKHMLKPIHNLRGRGVKAPALLALPNLLLQRFGRASREQVFAGVGVIVVAVVSVSLLTWLNDAHKPLARSIEAVERALPEVLEQVDGQVATLLGVDEETVQNVREGLAGTASGIVRVANAGSLAPAGPDTLLTPSTATPEHASSQPSADETPPPPATEEPLPAPEEPLPTTSEPTPPPTSEEPSPPTTEEPLPAPEEPPPVTEEPPPVTEEPSPATENPPPATEEPPPIPPGEAPPATDEPPTTDQPASPPTDDPSPAPEVSLPKSSEPPTGGHG